MSLELLNGRHLTSSTWVEKLTSVCFIMSCGEFLLGRDHGAASTSLKITSKRSTEDSRLYDRERHAQLEKESPLEQLKADGSRAYDSPFTSDSFLVTLGALAFKPMTSFLSPSSLMVNFLGGV